MNFNGTPPPWGWERDRHRKWDRKVEEEAYPGERGVVDLLRIICACAEASIDIAHRNQSLHGFIQVIFQFCLKPSLNRIATFHRDAFLFVWLSSHNLVNVGLHFKDQLIFSYICLFYLDISPRHGGSMSLYTRRLTGWPSGCFTRITWPGDQLIGVMKDRLAELTAVSVFC